MELSIGEVAQRAELATSALRFYEREGLIESAGRRSGRRVYDPSVLDRLAVVELAKNAGFTIAETKKLLRGFDRRTPPGKRWRALAATKLEELDRRIEEAQRMKRVLEQATACQCPSFEICGQAVRERQQA